MALQRRHALWLVIIAAHLVLLALLAGLAPRRPAQPDAARRLVTLKLLPLPRTEPQPRPEHAPRARQEAPADRRTPVAMPSPLQPATTAEPPKQEPAVEAVAATPATPAPPSLLNSEGTRQAIRLAARVPLLSERAASASQDPGRENPQQRFGREVARTAYGNCLKGEHPGSGAGLLSLPFWIAAEASGKCMK